MTKSFKYWPNSVSPLTFPPITFVSYAPIKTFLTYYVARARLPDFELPCGEFIANGDSCTISRCISTMTIGVKRQRYSLSSLSVSSLTSLFYWRRVCTSDLI